MAGPNGLIIVGDGFCSGTATQSISADQAAACKTLVQQYAASNHVNCTND